MHTGFGSHYSGMDFGSRDKSFRNSTANSGLSRMQDTYGLDLGRIEEQDEEHDGQDHSRSDAEGVLEMDGRELMGYDTTGSGTQVKTEDGGTEQPSGWTHESKTKVRSHRREILMYIFDEINKQSILTSFKAGKERKRLPLACIMCRRKK